MAVKVKIVCLSLLVLVSVYIGATSASAFSLPGFDQHETIEPARGVVSIPLTKVSDGKVHFFRIPDNGKGIDFFVVKGGDGVFHTAFDACDICYREKKGYRQHWDHVVCKNCNQRYPIAKIGSASGGGCNPSHLPSKNDGRSIVITVSDLKTGSRYF